MSKRILVVNDYDGLYGQFWGQLGEVSCDITQFMIDPSTFDLICFTGGEDVSPELYGHKNLASHNNYARDKKEVVIFEMAQKHEIPMTGICRGSQFLNVMCGGTMVQHLAKSHGGGKHTCECPDGTYFEVTSSHHQMSVPSKDGRVLAWARERVLLAACTYDGDLPIRVAEEPGSLEIRVTEAFAYTDQKIFAVQHHPEWQDVNEEAPQWTLRKIREICFKETAGARSM